MAMLSAERYSSTGVSPLLPKASATWFIYPWEAPASEWCEDESATKNVSSCGGAAPPCCRVISMLPSPSAAPSKKCACIRNGFKVSMTVPCGPYSSEPNALKMPPRPFPARRHERVLARGRKV